MRLFIALSFQVEVASLPKESITKTLNEYNETPRLWHFFVAHELV